MTAGLNKLLIGHGSSILSSSIEFYWDSMHFTELHQMLVYFINVYKNPLNLVVFGCIPLDFIQKSDLVGCFENVTIFQVLVTIRDQHIVLE